METTTRLSIHESLPFPAAYSTADGESVVTVNQDDLEAFVRTHNRLHKQLKISIFVVVVCVVAVLVRPYLPKEGVWSVLHTKEEVAQYHEMKELQAQLKAISEAAKQYLN